MSIRLTEDAKITRVMDAIAAGTSTQTSDIIDNKDFHGATFYAMLGDVLDTCALEFVIQQGSQAGGGDMADVDDGNVVHVADATDADDKVVAVEIQRPVSRYLRLKIVRATANAEIDGVLALQSDPKARPVTHDSSTVLDTGLALSPADE